MKSEQIGNMKKIFGQLDEGVADYFFNNDFPIQVTLFPSIERVHEIYNFSNITLAKQKILGKLPFGPYQHKQTSSNAQFPGLDLPNQITVAYNKQEDTIIKVYEFEGPNTQSYEFVLIKNERETNGARMQIHQNKEGLIYRSTSLIYKPSLDISKKSDSLLVGKVIEAIKSNLNPNAKKYHNIIENQL